MSTEDRLQTYRAHSRPNGRPVHPACTFRENVRPCSCDKLWQGWDGTNEHLDKLIIEALSAERRSKAFSSDSDMSTYLENDSRKGWDGFWSNAEHLRCLRGKDFIKGDMDMTRFDSSNWQRAMEANK